MCVHGCVCVYIYIYTRVDTWHCWDSDSSSCVDHGYIVVIARVCVCARVCMCVYIYILGWTLGIAGTVIQAHVLITDTLWL